MLKYWQKENSQVHQPFNNSQTFLPIALQNIIEYNWFEYTDMHGC